MLRSTRTRTFTHVRRTDGFWIPCDAGGQCTRQIGRWRGRSRHSLRFGSGTRCESDVAKLERCGPSVPDRHHVAAVAQDLDGIVQTLGGQARSRSEVNAAEIASALLGIVGCSGVVEQVDKHLRRVVFDGHVSVENGPIWSGRLRERATAATEGVCVGGASSMGTQIAATAPRPWTSAGRLGYPDHPDAADVERRVLGRVA
jgi:hypothetical protein